ncbi:MAG: protoporphyrinogen oxidase [Acidiferrobacterales bacterium]
MSQTDVLIIGGGISGLSLAWWLTQLGVGVEVWEADERVGGKIKSTRQDGYLTERAAAMVMNFRPEVVELVQATGLENLKTTRSPEAESRRYLLNNGQLTALPMRMGAMIASPLWSLRGKLRLLAEPFISAGEPDNESVSQFIIRRLGNEMLEKAMEPFIAGTLASDPDKANAAACLPRLTALEKRFGSITAGVLVNRLLRRRTACVTDTFSFNGGMNTLVNTLAQAPGVNLHTGYKADELVKKGNRWQVTASTSEGQYSLLAKHVVLTVPAPIAASLVSPTDHELKSLLEDIRYAPVTVLHMGFDRNAIKHPLDGVGFLVPRQERLPMTGNLWMSTLFPDRAPIGKVLLTTYLGGARTPEVAEWNDETTTDKIFDSLRKLIGLKANPEMIRIDRHQEALPLYYGAYQQRVRAISHCLQKHKGLHIGANYIDGVSVRDRIACARTTARHIARSLDTKTTDISHMPASIIPRYSG